MPISRQALTMRRAISPRLAIRSFLNKAAQLSAFSIVITKNAYPRPLYHTSPDPASSRLLNLQGGALASLLHLALPAHSHLASRQHVMGEVGLVAADLQVCPQSRAEALQLRTI